MEASIPGKVPLKQTKQVAVVSTSTEGSSTYNPIVLGSQVYDTSYNAVVEPVELFPATTIGDSLAGQANLVLQQFNAVITDKNKQDIGGKIYLALNDGTEITFEDTRDLFAHRGLVSETTWINQSVITMWMQMLVNCGNLIGYGRHINGLEPVGPPPIMFLPSTFVDEIKQNRRKNEMQSKLASPEFAFIKKPNDPRTIVLFPCYIHNNHWVLYAWRPSEMNKIYYYNSMIMAVTDDEILGYFEHEVAPYICMDLSMLHMTYKDGRAVSLMQRIQRDYGGQFNLVINTPRYNGKNVPDYEQTNGNDCGIFVCWYAYLIGQVGVDGNINDKGIKFRENINMFIQQMIVSFGVGYCTLIDFDRFELRTLGRGQSSSSPPSDFSDSSIPSPPPDSPDLIEDDLEELMADDPEKPSFKVTIAKSTSKTPVAPTQPTKRRITPTVITPTVIPPVTKPIEPAISEKKKKKKKKRTVNGSEEEEEGVLTRTKKDYTPPKVTLMVKPLKAAEYGIEKAKYEANVLKPLIKSKLDEIGTIYEYDENGIIYYLTDQKGQFILNENGEKIRVDPRKLMKGQKPEDVGRPKIADYVTPSEIRQYSDVERALKTEYKLRLMKWDAEHAPTADLRRRALVALQEALDEGGFKDFAELDEEGKIDEDELSKLKERYRKWDDKAEKEIDSENEEEFYDDDVNEDDYDFDDEDDDYYVEYEDEEKEDRPRRMYDDSDIVMPKLDNGDDIVMPKLDNGDDIIMPAVDGIILNKQPKHDDSDIIMPKRDDSEIVMPKHDDSDIVMPKLDSFSPNLILLTQTSAPPGGLSRIVVSPKADKSKIPPIKNGGQRKRAYGKRERGKKLEERRKNLAELFPGDTRQRHDDIIARMILKAPPEKKSKPNDDDDDDFES